MTEKRRARVLRTGTLSFTIESRILRELGERLVRQPEVALLELVKNAYDADATWCRIESGRDDITVEDDGLGMTLEQFANGWMRIGTSSKEGTTESSKYRRRITGEKGIGRFAVRFLGRKLHLESVAHDASKKQRTRLVADFDWADFDAHEDLGRIKVPYRLVVADDSEKLGTTLRISSIRRAAASINYRLLRTGSLGILTPLRSLFPESLSKKAGPEEREVDPGFSLRISEESGQGDSDVAASVLEAFVLRARVEVKGNKLEVKIFRKGDSHPYVSVVDTYPNELKKLHADIRFFPRRAGTFAGISVDGRRAARWVQENSGVAVFDKSFRVHPYGLPGDDWLNLAADSARNLRTPRSRIVQKHFPMSDEVKKSTSENWMLRLPQPVQLVGVVRVEGRRTADGREQGLIPSADREGFVENAAFEQLTDLVRGAVELVAFADKSLQLEDERKVRDALLARVRAETSAAIAEIRANPFIAAADKDRIASAIAQTQVVAEQHEESTRIREQQLEVMSLLGVVAGFMTHEFGVALQELENTHDTLKTLAKSQPQFTGAAKAFEGHIKQLRDFVNYATGYVHAARTTPEKAYPVRPRLTQVKRVFGRYAQERKIRVEIEAEEDLMAPLVPVSLYNGIALNLYTNALKAVTAKANAGAGVIAFRAWSDSRWHNLEVSDTGVGIPSTLYERIFDPLFTTTQSNNDPLGSGMGLGLPLVRRGVEAFGGKVEVVSPPAGFSTSVRVRLPIT